MATLDVSGLTSDSTAATNSGNGSPLPPVVILNMFYSGLGIARDLAGKGMRVVGLSADRNACGNFTRHCEIQRAPSSQHHPEELVEFLTRPANGLWGALIFPTRDSDVMLLDRYRAELQSRYILPIPSSRCLQRTVDKYELAIAARQVGIPVPRTIEVSSAKDLKRVETEVGFPCVLKPVTSLQWHMGDAWQQVGCRKAVRVDDWHSLELEYSAISKATTKVLAQEWIAGKADQIAVLGGYVGRDSELTSYFTARKILQSPDDCGTGCIVRTEALKDIVEPTRHLLRFLEYRGMAEVEYKYDSRNKEYRLIEINTRHWDQHQLGNAVGVNLSWIAYCDLTGTRKDVPSERGSLPAVPAVWIAEDALLIRLIRSIVHCELRVPKLWKKLSGRRIYAISAARDPFPGVRCFLGSLLPELVKSLFERIRVYRRSHV